MLEKKFAECGLVVFIVINYTDNNLRNTPKNDDTLHKIYKKSKNHSSNDNDVKRTIINKLGIIFGCSDYVCIMLVAMFIFLIVILIYYPFYAFIILSILLFTPLVFSKDTASIQVFGTGAIVLAVFLTYFDFIPSTEISENLKYIKEREC